MVIGVALLLLLGIATVSVLRRELDLPLVLSLIKKADALRLLPAVGCMAVYFLLMAANIRNGLSIFSPQKGLGKPMKYTMAGFFFSAVTPSSSGGQPAQLVYMSGDGICLSHGTFALLLELLSFVSASVGLGLAGGAVYFCEGGRLTGVLLLYICGFAINIAAIALICCFMFSAKVCRIICRLILRIGAVLFPKKNYRYKILRSVAEYRKAAKYLKNNSGIFIKMQLTSLLQLTALHSIPYFCCLSMTADISWLTATARQALLYASVSSLPFPGAAGVTEGGYALLFSPLMSEDLLGSTLILSRVISFLLPLAVSGIWLLLSMKIFKKKAS